MTEKAEEKKPLSALHGNSGFLHKSTDKTKEKSPDYFGRVDIRGKLYDIGGWTQIPEDKDKNPFISLNVDDHSFNEDQKKEKRKSYVDQYKADRKAGKNQDEYTLIEHSGTMHKQRETSKKEDYFGTILVDTVKVSFKGYMTVDKKNNPIVRIEISDGLRDQDERDALAKNFF